jgi:type VII secretion protein EccB
LTADTRDEVAADRFRRRRMRAALLEGDPDSPSRSLSRLGAGVYGGVLVTVLLLAVAGVYGVLRPGGSTAWQETGAFIVDDSGARYVYRDGVLHPVLNFASAKLLLGEGLHVVTVSTPSLSSAARGPMIGIPMAPDSLPDAAHVTGADWSVCAVGRAVDGEQLHTEIRPGVAAAGSPADDGTGYLVRTEAGGTYLVRSGRTHEIDPQWLRARGSGAAAPIRAQDVCVSTLPAGEPLAPPDIPGLGEPGPALPGSAQPTAVGSIYADRTNAYYVVTRAGLATLTPLQAQLLLADPALSAAYAGSSPAPLKVSQAQVTEASPQPLPARSPDLAAAPAVAPTLAELPPGEQQLCARHLGGAAADLVVGPAESMPGPAASSTAASGTAAPGTTAPGTTAPGTAASGTAASGTVRLAPGAGALVAQRQGTDSRGGTVYLVTDSGIRYPLAGQRTIETLGLAEAPVAQLAPELLAALPVGPTLDPDAAAAPAE